MIWRISTVSLWCHVSDLHWMSCALQKRPSYPTNIQCWLFVLHHRPASRQNIFSLDPCLPSGIINPTLFGDGLIIFNIFCDTRLKCVMDIIAVRNCLFFTWGLRGTKSSHSINYQIYPWVCAIKKLFYSLGPWLSLHCFMYTMCIMCIMYSCRQQYLLRIITSSTLLIQYDITKYF